MVALYVPLNCCGARCNSMSAGVLTQRALRKDGRTWQNPVEFVFEILKAPSGKGGGEPC